MKKQNAQEDAARAMLAALEEALPFVCSMDSGFLPERRVRIEQWNKVRAAIASAKAAGIEAEG